MLSLIVFVCVYKYASQIVQYNIINCAITDNNVIMTCHLFILYNSIIFIHYIIAGNVCAVCERADKHSDDLNAHKL